MLTPVRSTAFKRDVKRAERRGKDMARLRAVLAMLIEGVALPERYRDHPLKGSGPAGETPMSAPIGC